MSRPEADDVDDDFAELLAAVDESLAAGRTPTAPDDASEPVAERLQRARPFLQLLDQLRARPAAPSDLLGGRPLKVGRFVIERELGRGGFGIVYAAHDPLVGRTVAVKIPRMETLARPELLTRFLREAQAAGALAHPHIVPLLEADQLGAACYLVSAYCAGPNLLQWMKQHEVRPERSARILLALAEAVEHAHGRGVLHRDIKPSNVLMDGDQPRITDFGLAKLLDAEPAETPTGLLLGTPGYMAPEQAVGSQRQVGPATDVYGLGAVLYELLTGRPPFGGSNVLETLEHVRTQEPPAPSEFQSVPRDLETICLKCLRKQPEQRYPSAAAFAADLRRFLDGQAILARPVGWRDRIDAWSRSPDRVPQAGYVTLVWGAVFSAFTVLLFCMILAGNFDSADNPFAITYGLVLLLGWYLPALALGLGMIQRKARALWLGTVSISTYFPIIGASMVLSFSETYIAGPEYSSLALVSMVLTFSGAVLANDLIALRAHYANRATVGS